jgi:arylsulfatase A-like enzyme
MLNVPLFLWWPNALPSGLRIAETVEAIDLMPTLLELSRLPFPEEVQGQSLVPLLAEGTRPGELGWRSRPAFAERRYAPAAFSDDEKKLDSFAIIADGWKLIRNTARPEGWPEYELFDHVNDPLNLNNVATDEPEILDRLAEQLEAWREATVAARVEADESTEGISAEELQRLRSLGYVQ